jgi:hypothetical protein
LVIGGYLLASELMIAWFDFEGPEGQLAAAAIMVMLAAPFLLLGTWASPGNRLAELGLTLMIVAAVGGAMALIMFVVLHDPGFKQLMPPNQPMPELHFALVSGVVNLLMIGGVGYALRRWGLERARVRREQPDLERIFGDE